MKKLLAIALSAILLISCLGGTAFAAEAGYKDTIRIAYSYNMEHVNPFNNTGSDMFIRAAYSSLVRRGNYDENGKSEIEADLAESWETSEDGLIWTFKIKQGVKFHNGKELTANDVKASADLLLFSDTVFSYTNAFEFIKGVEVIDDYTIAFQLDAPKASFLAQMAMKGMLVLDADYIEKYGAEVGYAHESINGTGPYKIQTFEPETVVVMERFEDYHGEPAFTKYIESYGIADPGARAVALETGELDITTRLDNTEMLRIGDSEGFKLLIPSLTGMYNFAFNNAHPLMEDPRIKQAMVYATDYQAIIDGAFMGGALGDTLATSVMAPAVDGYVQLGPIARDLDKAKALMAEAGYPDGFSIKLMSMDGYQNNLVCAEILANSLKDIGISVEIVAVDRATWNAIPGTPRDKMGEYALIALGASSDSGDCEDMFFNYWVSENDGTTNANGNRCYYSNAEFDELALAQGSEMDPEKRAEMLKRCQEILYLEDPVAIWTVCTPGSVQIMKDTVENMEFNNNNLMKIETLKIRKD